MNTKLIWNYSPNTLLNFNKRISSHVLLIALLSFSNIFSAVAQEPLFNFATSAGSSSFDETLCATSDGNNNLYTAGIFSGNADFDPSGNTYNLVSSGPTDIFFQKVDASGNFVWAYKFGGKFNERCNAIAYDYNGYIWLAGFFSDTAIFSAGNNSATLISAGREDIFIAKIDTSGNLILAKSIGGAGNETANGIAIDGLGNLYITGSFQNNVNFNTSGGSLILTSSGYNDIFIAKYSSLGDLVWAKSEGSILTDAGNAICVTKAGCVYITGYFSGTVNFNTDGGIFNITSAGGIDAFVQKFNSSGIFLWATNAGGTGADEGTGISFDNSGNTYTTGRYDSVADFDGSSAVYNVTSKGNSDIFILKTNTTGNFVFAKSIGSKLTDVATSITVSNSKDVFITGFFQDIADFNADAGINNLNSKGLTDAFIERLDTSGNYLWATNIGNSGNDKANYITNTINSKIIVGGYFSKTTDLDYTTTGTSNFTSNGSADAFTIQLDNCIGLQSDVPNLSAASTDICSIDTAKLYVASGKLRSAGYWKWYSGSCGGTVVGTGDTIYVKPGVTTTYYARGEGGCVFPSECSQIIINVTAAQTWYKDEDNDGYFIDSVLTCTVPSGNGWTITRPANGFGDCNDLDALYAINELWYKDEDNDGYFVDSVLQCTAPSGSGWTITRPANGFGDCNDADGTINPGTIWYQDLDGDGYYKSTLTQCVMPSGIGWSTLPGSGGNDCDDNNNAINPGVAEICGNGIDDNCNGLTDEGCLALSLSSTTISCNGGKSTITATASNGTPPYKYSIDAVNYKLGNTFLVGAGTYKITTKDGINNTTSQSITITEPSAISINFTKKDVSCNGGNDGSITINASGGTPPYQYSFDDGVTYQADSVKSNLAIGGSYILRVKDANNCMQRRSGFISITQPTKLNFLGACYITANKVLGVQGSGGTKPYTFSFNGGAYVSGNQRNGDARTWANVQLGTYTVNIKDSKNCIVAKTLKTDTLPACPSSSPVSFTGKTVDENILEANIFFVSVSPNPTQNTCRIEIKSSFDKIVSVIISDISGRIVYANKNAAGVNFIGEKWSPGIYIAEITDGSNIKRIKIIKE